MIRSSALARWPIRAGLLASVVLVAPAQAQKTTENAVASADDAFGGAVGLETSGIYSELDVRGFSPSKAGNVRVDGVYFDQVQFLSGRIRAQTAIRVGFAALDYPFPAPSGISDGRLRSANDSFSGSISATRWTYGGLLGDFDVSIPLIKDHLNIVTGVGAGRTELVDGASNINVAAVVKPRIRFGGVEFQPFWAPVWTRQLQSRPLIVSTGAFLPPEVQKRVYLGQTWAKGKADNVNWGGTLKAQISPSLSFRGGAFQSRTDKLKGFTEIFAVTNPNGTAAHRFFADPRQLAFSNSWEGQFGWRKVNGDWQHRILLGARGRFRHTESGGSDPRNFGTVTYGQLDREPEPVFNFGPVNLGTIRQHQIMLGYLGKLAHVGQLNLGVQKAHYRARFRAGTALTRSAASPWLYNASLELEPSSALAFYIGYVRGLEDSGTAPENAANRSEQLPASLTRQIDGGVRLKVKNSQLVVGLFDLRRPYFTFDPGNQFVQLGNVQHKGAEISYTGMIAKRLQIVAGAVLMKPSVSGTAVTLKLVGDQPVGVAKRFIRIDTNYRTNILGGVTATFSLLHRGKQAASAQPFAALGGEQLMIPARTTFDLGARHRFKIGETPASVRFVVQNVMDKKGWRVLASNTFQAEDRQRITLALAADF